MIQLQSLGKSFGGRVIFKDLSWHIKPGERSGLVGDNGAGKSTLLKILAGIESYDEGEISTKKDMVVGYLLQESSEPVSENRLLDEVLGGRGDLALMEKQLAELTDKLHGATGAQAETLTHEFSELHEKFEVAGGFNIAAKAKAILMGMGFRETDFNKPVESFSGGWRTRARLCRLLLRAPDLLLLDEPTNHLDLESTVWLEGFLRSYEGSLVIISHDRYFLNRMVTSIAELEFGKLTVYPYAYNRYIEEKRIRREMLEKRAALQSKEIEKQEKFIERFKAKATKAAQAQSRVKALEKIERIEVMQETKSVNFRFMEAGRIGQNVVELLDVSAGYGDKIVYSGLNFLLRRGDRVALAGPNGAGKSTLLKIIAGVLHLHSGRRATGPNVIMRHFAQHQVDALDMESAALDEVINSIPNDSIPMARTCLGAFLFHGDDVFKPIKVLSGGEKSRVALSKIALTPTNLLLLDEPTNHLDLKSRKALEDALKGYGGCIVMISHDRAFIDAVATKVIHVEHGKLTEYLGDYAYYESRRMNESKNAESYSETSDDIKFTKKDARREAAKKRTELNTRIGPMSKRLAKVEEEIAAQESRIAELEERLADPAMYSDKEKTRETTRELAATKDRNDALMAEWETLSEEIENVKAEMGG